MKKRFLTKMVGTASLAALVVILAFVPLKTMGLEITFAMVPVAVGAIVFGPVSGAFLGGVFGVVSFLQCLGYSPFGVALLSIDPWLTMLVCIPTRILAGWVSGLAIKLFNTPKFKSIGYPVAALAAPLLNTVFFMSTLVLAFYNTDFIQGFVSALGAANPFVFVIAFVGINGLVELIAGFIIALPAAIGVSKVTRRLI